MKVANCCYGIIVAEFLGGGAWDRLGITAQEDTLSLRTDLYWTESQLHLTTSANPSYDRGPRAAGRAATAPSTKLKFNQRLCRKISSV
ncbi:MAG: hypothetical protein ACPHDJ_06280, partial [Candidatus Puniceispirillaceae bacterium]